MTEIRKIYLPEKDQPLRADVSLLGSLVGEMLVDQHGPELLALVERVRTAAISRRESGNGPAGDLESALSQLDADQINQVIHAFTSYLRAVNLAEKVHRIRRRRTYQREATEPQRGSFEEVLERLHRNGATPAELMAQISRLRIQPVFTAHPTEATRRTIQEKEYDILLRLVDRLNPQLTPSEESLALERIRGALTTSWQTRLEPHAKPTVADELDNILFYITDILYRAVPGYYESLEQAFERRFGEYPEPIRDGIILRFGSWVGGDMDGNPNVTADTILATLVQQRTAVIRKYIPELKRLARYLSQSLSEIGVSAALQRRVARYREMMPETGRQIPERHFDMPYRCLLAYMMARLSATLSESDQAYATVDDFIEDIELIRDSLTENRGRHAGLFNVNRLLRRVRTFGFHLVTLDVRQDALLHRRVIGELLGCKDWEQRDPANRAATLAELIRSDALPSAPEHKRLSEEARSTLAVFQAISAARQRYGPAAIGLFIISMTQGADDVLTAMALAGIASPHLGAVSRLDVSPLLETVNDLAAGQAIFRDLLAMDVYRNHLKSLGDRQIVMVGYSDSNKDSGIVASRWALYEAQRQLVATGRAHGVAMVFFHGRGGTVSRGGGNLVNGILGAPPGTVNGFLRLTEQGEVINQKYGVRFLALRNLEMITGATLAHTMQADRQGLNEDDSRIVSRMAEVSRQRFRSVVYEDPAFPDYFRSATPIDVIERLNIGSRPASRRSGQGIENLRAIPWVFSWAQIRVGFPGVFGFGTALDQAIKEFGLENVRNLMNRQIFFQAMVGDVEMVLAKSELGLGRRYSDLAGEDKRYFYDGITAEFDLARCRILELKQLDNLLDDQRVLQRNIRLRNPYVDPLHLLQIDLLRRWRAGGRENEALLDALKGTVKGIALGIQNTG
jgi:phosphoenolpyruvate carboxylase